MYAMPLQNGDVAAVVINWRELDHGEFEFNLKDIGVVAKPNDHIAVKDLWTHKVDGFSYGNGVFKVSSIAGHGNHALRFHVEKSNKPTY